MEHEILDSERKKRKPVPVVKTGLFFGTIALLLFILIFSVLPVLFGPSILLGEFTLTTAGFISGSLCFVLPLMIGLFRIAAWGKRKLHFLRVLATGLVCYQVIIIGAAGILLLATIISKPEKPMIDITTIKGMAYGNIFVFVLAFIFWLIPGKLPYFRKQMEL